MSKDIDIKPRILIAEGPWGILEGQLHDGFMGLSTLGQGYDVITHKCNWTTNWFLKTYYLSVWMMKQETPCCPHCNANVPSMIQTLWTLKNMDNIQADAEYGMKPWPTSFTFYPGRFYGSMKNIRPGQVIPYNTTKVKL